MAKEEDGADTPEGYEQFPASFLYKHLHKGGGVDNLAVADTFTFHIGEISMHLHARRVSPDLPHPVGADVSK